MYIYIYIYIYIVPCELPRDDYALHTRYIFRYTVASVFSYVPYVVHPFIARYSCVTTRRCICSSSVCYTVLSVICLFCTFIIRLLLVTFCQIFPNLAPCTNE